MQKKRVLYVLHGLAPGGIEAFILNVLDNINKDIFEVSFALATYGKQFHEERVIKSGAKVYKTSDLDGIRNILRHFVRLVKLIRREGPFDVVHSNIDFFNGVNLLAAFIAGVPKRISHCHSTHSAAAVSSRTSSTTRMYHIVMRTLIKICATHWLGCSDEANNYMYGHNWRRKRNAMVIYNGIEISRFFKVNRNASSYRKKSRFLTVGKMSEAKNGLFIVEVINELHKVRNDISFTWVGSGPLENKIKKKIYDLCMDNTFIFLGNRKDIPEIMASSDYFLFPSKWEGLPVSLIEAQAAGMICFISDKITGEANLGLCTVISLSENAAQWAKIIDVCMNDSNQKIDIEKLNKFDIKNTVKTFEKIYMGS